MANTLSVMLRNVVSKKRRRYIDRGFNLDLAYICHNIIAMGYPGEYIQSVFRNPMNHVCQFFEVTHPGHYKVYNLRSEKAYDVNKFHGRVSVYAFEDHNPPTIELIEKFCNDIDLWLKADLNNVAAIHCKAGKGRTGTMICCYLLYSGIKTTAEDALAYYGEKRTMNKKGVTIPSQRRYVHYYAKLIRSKLKYERRKLQLCEIRFSPATTLQSHGNVQCLISTMEEIDCTETQTSKVHDIDSAGSWTKVTVKELDKFSIDFRKTFTLDLADQYVFVTGDVKVELKKLFHFWFNSYFVCDTAAYEGEGEDMKLIYTLPKWELDVAHKDKEHNKFSEDFKVQLVLKPVPPDSRNIIDGNEITQLRQHNNQNNHVNSLTHNSHNNANMLLTHQLTHGSTIPTSSKSGDPNSDAYHNLTQYQVERSRKPTSLPSFSPLSAGGIAGGSSHMPLNLKQNLMQRHHQQQQKRSSEPTPSVKPESINRSNNKNHNNSSYHQQQQQQQQSQPHPNHHHRQHHLHHEQQQTFLQQQQLQNQQQLQSQQQNNKSSTSSNNIHNTSSNSNSSSSSSISSQSSSSSSSVGVGGGGGGGGVGGGEEEDWESGESSTTTTTSTTTTPPTTTSYFSYKRLISSQNDDDDDNLNKNVKNDDDDDGVALISSDSITKPLTTTATITTTTTTINTVTTTTTTTINNSKSKTSPTTGSVDFSENTNSSALPFSIPQFDSLNNSEDDNDGINPTTTVNSKVNDFADSLSLPIPLSHPPSFSSTNGLQKPSTTSKCTTGSKFLKLINSQRFKAKTISPAMGSSLALNSSSVVSTCPVVQNQLLKKKKAKSKTIPLSKLLHSYFRTDPDFHENLSQQTTIPMGRRNSAGSISSRNHLNSVGSASGIGRAGSVEKGFRLGGLESRGIAADCYKSDDEEDFQFVAQDGTVPVNAHDKSSGTVKKSAENSIMMEYRIAVPSLIKSSGFNKTTTDFSLSLGTSPVDKALRNVVDVGTQLSSISPVKDKELIYESDSDNSMSQSNAAALLTKNNFIPAQLDTSNCDAATCLLPRVALGKSSLPFNERTTSIGSSNNSTSMDHLCVPYSNMYLSPQSTLDDSGDTEVYHDHDDYYSSICDNQLSFNNSPCKSPRSLSDTLDLKPAITHRILLGQTDGSSPNAKVTANAASAATVASGRKNTTSSDGIVIAKPVESHSIGFNVGLASATTNSTPQTTEKYNMDVDCDDIDSSSALNVNSTPARRKSPSDSILNLIIKPDSKSVNAVTCTSSIDGEGSVDVGDDTDYSTGNVSPNNPKAGGSSSSSSGYCCVSEGSQSVSSTSSGVVDTTSSSGTAFSLERNSLDGGSNGVVVINSKKKFSLPTPEIEVVEIGMTKNRSSSVSNNNNHSNFSTFSSSSLLSSSPSGSSIDNNDKH